MRPLHLILMALTLWLANPGAAQTSADRAVSALRHTLEASLPADVLHQVQAELLAVLAEHPNSEMAQAILMVPKGQQQSLLQMVQQGLAETGAAAVSPTECTQTDRIISLAERIMVQRADITGFAQANYGDEAAYLWLHYANPSFGDGIARMREVAANGRRAPRQMTDLMLTYAYANLPPDQAAAQIGMATDAALMDMHLNAVKALIAADDGITFFPMLQAAFESGAFTDRYLINLNFPQGLFHLDDTRKLAIAQRAEAVGFLPFAHLLLTNLKDQSSFDAFIARHRDRPETQDFATEYYGGNALISAVPMQPRPGQRIDVMPMNFFHILRAGLLMGEADFLNVLFNQTGWEAEIASASRSFLERLDRGETASIGQLDKNWLSVYDEIAARRGLDDLVSQMRRFDVSTKVRHYAGQAQDMIDWMRAVRSLTPFLRGQVAQLPQRPKLLSKEFNWQTWQRLAKALGQGQRPAADTPQERMIMAELLIAAGRVDDAIDFAQTQMAPKPRLTFYRDLMKRLDRTCAAHSASLGQAILLGGQTAFRFGAKGVE